MPHLSPNAHFVSTDLIYVSLSLFLGEEWVGHSSAALRLSQASSSRSSRYLMLLAPLSFFSFSLRLHSRQQQTRGSNSKKHS